MILLVRHWPGFLGYGLGLSKNFTNISIIQSYIPSITTKLFTKLETRSLGLHKWGERVCSKAGGKACQLSAELWAKAHTQMAPCSLAIHHPWSKLYLESRLVVFWGLFPHCHNSQKISVFATWNSLNVCAAPKDILNPYSPMSGYWEVWPLAIRVIWGQEGKGLTMRPVLLQ